MPREHEQWIVFTEYIDLSIIYFRFTFNEQREQQKKSHRKMNGNVSSRWISHHFFVNVKSAIIHAEQISTLGGGRELFVFARSFNCLQMIENNVTKSMYSLDNGQVAYSLHLSNSAWNISAAKNCDKFTVSASHNDWRPEQWEYPLAFEYFSRRVSRWDFYILNFACNSFFFRAFIE